MKRQKKSSSSTADTPHAAYLALGSNLGDRERNLYDAVRMIRERIGAVSCSSVYETDPMYIDEQPRFLNAVCGIQTSLLPATLLETTQAIEAQLGRNRAEVEKKGPRTIDIDILLYENQIINTESLTIPHPGIIERKFVLVPLIELSKNVRDPATGAKYAEVLLNLGEQGVYYFSMKRYSLQDHGG